MKFENISNASILLSVEQKQITLLPGKTIETDCGANPTVCFQHDYHSSSLTVEEIRHEEATNNTSVVDLFLLDHRPPYFQIVLNSTYQLFCPKDATITIRREKLRPRFFCVYDRFFPVVSAGNILEIKQDFGEKEEFINRYKMAVDSPNRGIISAIVIGVAVLGLPITILLLLANLIAGLIVAAIEVVGLIVLYFIANHTVKAINSAEQKTVLSNLESDQIIKHFSIAREKYSERIQID